MLKIESDLRNAIEYLDGDEKIRLCLYVFDSLSHGGKDTVFDYTADWNYNNKGKPFLKSLKLI